MQQQEGTITRKRSFAQIPDDLVTDQRVSSHAVRLWARLDKYAGNDGRAFPSRETLAADLGLSVSGVKRALAELTEAGWISRETRDGKSALTRLHERSTRVTGEPVPGSPVSRGRVTGEPRPGSPVSHKGDPRRRPTEGDAAPPARAGEPAAPGSDLALFDGPPRPQQVTAQTLVGGWLEKLRIRPPDRVIGAVAKQCRELLDEGTAPDLIAAALGRWQAKGLHPSTLPSVVNEIANARPAARPGQDIDWAAAAQRAAAREGSA